MADIELVIKIPEGIKQEFEREQWTALSCMEMKDALMNGTPLPKGHGRLVDADAVIKKMEEREEKLKDDRSMWETAGVVTALDMFGETIIGADK